jgi:excisionase family DNA binding protein
MEPTTYTPAQAAEILGMKTSSVYALISRHELAANKVGRSRYISISQLEAYLKNRGSKDVIDYTYAK